MLKITFFLLCTVLGVLGKQVPNESPVSPRIDPLVTTRVGLIRGLRSEDGLYAKFLGIPYGRVDEENPFGPSTPQPEFEEPFNAYDGSVKCPQTNRQGDPVGHIQCLNLNVYVPNGAHSQNRLPVMVYIHGGAFVSGSGTDPLGSPKYLIQKDVVVVFINYRLGIYGFTCTDSPRIPGNNGLRDQYLALKWIKDNIESFGGDRDKVTVFGESAGGMSIHLQLLSPREKVFDRAIIQSGPSTSPWTIEDMNNNVPIELAKALGFVTEDLDEAIDFISRADVSLTVAAAHKLTKASQYSSEPLTKACVEKEFEGIDIFVPVNPNEATTEKAKTIPVMIGIASQELIFQHGSRNSDFFSNYSFKDLLGFGMDVTDFDEMSNLVRRYYIGDEAASDALNNEITSFASDFIFNHPTERAVKLLLESDATAVYHYMLSYVGGLSLVSSMNTSIVGTPHADEIMYLFETTTDTDVISDEDQLMIDRLATMWTNFAKYGDPTPETTDLLPVKWEQVSKETTSYLNIDKDLSMKRAPFHDRMAFWDLFYQLNESKTKWYKGE